MQEEEGAEKKSGSADPLVGVDVSLDELDDFILLVTREEVGLLENLPELARGSLGSGRLGVGAVEQKIRTHAQGVGQCRELFRSQRNGHTFPMGDSALRGAELVGELGLGEAGLLACGSQAFAEGCAGTLCGSSSHGGRIQVSYQSHV